MFLRPRPQQVVLGCVLLGATFALGALAGTIGETHSTAAAGCCLLAAAPVLLLRPEWAALLAVAVLPFDLSVVIGGINVGPADVLLALVLAGVLIRCVGERAIRVELQVLRPLAAPLSFYFGVAVITTSAHLSSDAVIALLQRAEVVLVAMIAGVVLVGRGLATIAMWLFLASAVGLTALWTVGGGHPVLLAGQKNPAGQLIVDAAIVALAVVRTIYWRIPLVLLLVVGAYATQSRGSLVGLVVGLLVYFALRSRDPLQFVAQTVAIAIVVIGVYETLPQAAQDRLRGDTSSTRYNDALRRAYAVDAKAIIRANPLVGVGVGNYLAGDPVDMTQTDDPHQVILLEAAEGGYGLAIAFGVLQLGALVLIARRREMRHDVIWVAPACAVQAAIVTHAFVDVYWVRGTPVAGWLLIGMAAAAIRRHPSAAAPGDSAPNASAPGDAALGGSALEPIGGVPRR